MEDSTIVKRILDAVEQLKTAEAAKPEGDTDQHQSLADFLESVADTLATSIRYKSAGSALRRIIENHGGKKALFQGRVEATVPQELPHSSSTSFTARNEKMLLRLRLFAFTTSLVWSREYTRSRTFARVVRRQMEELQRLRKLCFQSQNEVRMLTAARDIKDEFQDDDIPIKEVLRTSPPAASVRECDAAADELQSSRSFPDVSEDASVANIQRQR